MTNMEQLDDYVSKASRAERLALCAVTLTLSKDAPPADYYFSEFTRDECERAIGLCKMAQTDYRQKGRNIDAEMMAHAEALIKDYLRKYSSPRM